VFGHGIPSRGFLTGFTGFVHSVLHSGSQGSPERTPFVNVVSEPRDQRSVNRVRNFVREPCEPRKEPS
jgi:hypothetical protein